MTKDFVIWVETEKGQTYYVDNNFNLIGFNNNLTFEEFKKTAKKYNEKSCKRIFTILHKKYTEVVSCNASSISLHFEKFHTYLKDNVKYVIL